MPKLKVKATRKVGQDKPAPLHIQLLSITTRLLVDVQCMRDLFRTVTPLIEDQDRASLDRLTQLVKKLTLLTKTREKDDSTTTKFAMTYAELKTLKETTLRYQRADHLFRSNALTTLIAMFDTYMSGLISIALLAYPDRLTSSDKSITYEEAVTFTSIEEIKKKFVSKEVEQVMRGSHDDQFKSLETVANVKFRDGLPMWQEFIEITERRNVHVHCAGEVSGQYLRVCREHRVELPSEIKEGSFLPIDEAYFATACHVIWLMGFTIGQTVVRKLFPKEISRADDALNEIGFDLFLGEDWALAYTVFDYATTLPAKAVGNDFYRKMFLINKCIALKCSGKSKECLEELGKVDWSSATSRYVLAVAVLRDNFEEAGKLMVGVAKGSHAIDESGFREWPLFREFRKTEYFQRAFKKIFKKDFTQVSLSTLTSLKGAAESSRDIPNKSEGPTQ